MPARNRETRPYTAPQARTVGLRFPNWTRFSFTLPPSASTSAISAAFSSILHFRRRSTRARISTSDTRTSFWSDRRLQQSQLSAVHAPLATRPRPGAYVDPAPIGDQADHAV